MGIFSTSDESREIQYIGSILKELNAGKTLKALLLEMSWAERAKLLLNLKQVRRCNDAFLKEVGS
jgi:hypothetical protein